MNKNKINIKSDEMQIIQITEWYKARILREINDLEIDRPTYLCALISEVEGLEFPEEFIANCKKAISKNKAFKHPAVIEFLSGFELSDLLGLK